MLYLFTTTYIIGLIFIKILLNKDKNNLNSKFYRKLDLIELPLYNTEITKIFPKVITLFLLNFIPFFIPIYFFFYSKYIYKKIP